MKQQMFWIPEALKAELEAFCAARNIALAVVIRKSIEQYLRRAKS
jgi:hypothetical protein